MVVVFSPPQARRKDLNDLLEWDGQPMDYFEADQLIGFVTSTSVERYQVFSIEACHEGLEIRLCLLTSTMRRLVDARPAPSKESGGATVRGMTPTGKMLLPRGFG